MALPQRLMSCDKDQRAQMNIIISAMTVLLSSMLYCLCHCIVEVTVCLYYIYGISASVQCICCHTICSILHLMIITMAALCIVL